MPPWGDDFGGDLLAAKERDLGPLLAECGRLLDLDEERAALAADFFDLAWFSGVRTGRDRMEARVKEDDPDLTSVSIERFETDFRELLEQSAEVVELDLPEAIALWSLLHQAWLAGVRTCEAELYGLYLELRGDVAEEALRWLENRQDDPAP